LAPEDDSILGAVSCHLSRDMNRNMACVPHMILRNITSVPHMILRNITSVPHMILRNIASVPHMILVSYSSDNFGWLQLISVTIFYIRPSRYFRILASDLSQFTFRS